MSSFDLKSKSVFVFDAFGTIFRTAPIDSALKDIAGEASNELLEIWRRKQLEYSWLRNQMNAYIPFNQVTREALKYAMNKLDINNPKIFEILLPIYDAPGLIDGARDLISMLKKENKKVNILSNGTIKMLQNGILKTNLDSQIDRVFSVDEIGIYKPHPAVYEMLLSTLGFSKDKIVFFSSNQWDVSGASHFGLDCVWVNQYQETKEVLPFGLVQEVNSLEQISIALKT